MQIIITFRLTPAGGAIVTDGYGNELYKAKGKVLSLFRKKRLFDLNGEKLYTIRNKFWRLPFSYSAIIKNSEGEAARIKSKFHNFQFTVKNCTDDIVIEGRFLDPNFAIYKNGVLAATARSQLSLNGKMVLDVVNASDNEFMVALVIAMNNVVKNRAR